MSLKVYELRELLKNADDYEEVIVVSDFIHIFTVANATHDWIRTPGNTRTKGILIRLEQEVPIPRVCPDCNEKWDDDDDF